LPFVDGLRAIAVLFCWNISFGFENFMSDYPGLRSFPAGGTKSNNAAKASVDRL